MRALVRHWLKTQTLELLAPRVAHYAARVGLRELEKGKFEVERAVFALDPNKCASKIVGRELELVRSGSGSGVKFEVSVLSGNERLYSCEPAATLVGASAALRQSAVECSWVN